MPPRTSPADEVELIASARAGGDRGREAFRVLVERYQRRVFAAARDILGSTADAEDVAQEAFVKAYLSLASFRGDSSFFSWVYRIASNLALDAKRRTDRRGGPVREYEENGERPSNGGEMGGGVSESPFDTLRRRELGKSLAVAMKELSPEHRAVVTLREVDGLSYEEIAAATGTPQGTVMSRLFYARKVLRKILAPVWEGPLVEDEQEPHNKDSVMKETIHTRGERS